MLLRVIILAILAILVVGFVVLAVWDVPPPRNPVEKTLPNDRFPR